LKFGINNINFKDEMLYQSILRICYKIVHLHKLSYKDLGIIVYYNYLNNI